MTSSACTAISSVRSIRVPSGAREPELELPGVDRGEDLRAQLAAHQPDHQRRPRRGRPAPATQRQRHDGPQDAGVGRREPRRSENRPPCVARAGDGDGAAAARPTGPARTCSTGGSDVTIAKPTASDSGTNSARAAPCMKNDGMNTARMQSMASRRGTAVSRVAPPHRPGDRFGVCSICVWMFSTSTVASSTRMPTARARPPSVIRLIVCPVSHRATTAPSRAKRNVEHDDDHAPPVAQEQQHHQPGQDRRRAAPSVPTPHMARVT